MTRPVRDSVAWSPTLPESASPDVMLDLAGVGIGPANLSLAALVSRVPELRTRFVDVRPEFNWHPGLMLPNSTINVSFLKDLVTLADPTHPLSFLSFLHSTRDIYSFINAELGSVSRREFNEYLRWACEHLESLQWSTAVERIVHEDGAFTMHTDHGALRTRHVVLGTGLRRFVPPCVTPHLGSDVFHAAEFMLRAPRLEGKRVAVIGGGQTGAEMVLGLLERAEDRPAQVIWVSRRKNFEPLDASAFANELYTPEYSDYFSRLPFEVRQQLLQEQKMTSDGINHELLKRIYQKLYEIRFLDKEPERWRLCPGRELVGLERGAGGLTLETYQRHSDAYEAIDADVLISSTGYSRTFPTVLEPLRDRIPLEGGEFFVNDDYSIRWDGPDANRIYVQNAAQAARGVADPNLSLNAWRAARITNSLAERTVYDIEGSSSMVDWGPANTPGYERCSQPVREPGIRARELGPR